MNPFCFAFRLLRQAIVTAAIKFRNIFFAAKVVLFVKNRKDYFYDIYCKNKKGKIIYEVKDKKYLTRAKTKDRDIFAEIVLGNEYFTNEIELNEKSVVFDVGAQAGIFSVFISDKAGKVFSFEPVPQNFELLEENIRLNVLEKKVKTFNLAVSGKKGKEKIFLSENNSGGHSVYGKGKFVEAQTITLKDVFEENKLEECDLLKMDVEGAEYDIFYSLEEKYVRKIKRIAMECHKIDSEKKNTAFLVKFLRTKGFKVKERKSLYNFTVILAVRG